MIRMFVLAVGLSADAFAVSVTRGASIQRPGWKDILTIGILFGLFQAIMPLIGWAAGEELKAFIIDFDHWIAFGILSFIGGKMIYEAGGSAGECEEQDCKRGGTLLLLAVATSIDALAVGFSMPAMATAIATPVLIIGLTTFVLSSVGVVLGRRFGTFFKTGAEIVGGIILIGIGLSILYEHTM